MAIIHFIGTIVIYNEASSQLISIRNSITIVILFPLLCIYWLLGSLEMCSLDLVTLYLQNNQEHCCDKILTGNKKGDLICLVIDFRFQNLLEKGEN